MERREWGSKCVLVARCMYIVYVFMQKACVVEFYARVTQCLWERFWDRGIWALRAIVGCTAAASIIATLAECRPFEKYCTFLHSRKTAGVDADPGLQGRFHQIPAHPVDLPTRNCSLFTRRRCLSTSSSSSRPGTPSSARRSRRERSADCSQPFLSASSVYWLLVSASGSL